MNTPSSDAFTQSRHPDAPALQGGLRGRSARSAFSLIEVVLALGVLSCAFLTLFSLIPIGEGLLSQSIDATVGMQIVQQVTTIASQSRFSELSKVCKSTVDADGKSTDDEKTPDYFFDEQGNTVDSAASPNCVYTAALVALDASTLPGRSAVVATQTVDNVEQIKNSSFATINIIIRKNGAAKAVRTVNVAIANNGF